MAENELIVTAGLNFNASESLILSQLETIQNDFNKKGGLQINCTVNGDSLKAIQSQLSSLKQTLSVDINASHIQQSISQATKVEPVKINVTAEINKGELQRQAKEIEKALSIQYPKGQTQQLRDELKAYLSNYQKAIASNDLSGMETAIEKIAEFAGSYRKEVEIVNEELKYQQDRTREILKEQEKLYITAEQYAALQREVSKDGRTATQVLNSSIGVGRWSTDITKFDPRNLPYWSKFATEVNNINPLKDAILNEGDIVQGVNDLNAFLGKSVDMTSQYLKANEQTWVEWRDIVHDAVSVARGEGNIFSDSFIDLTSDAGVSRIEDNAQKLARAYSTVQAAKDLYQNDKSVKSVTADWTFDANKNVTGFTINVNKLNGEVERLKHSISETGDVEFLGGNASDRGVQKQTETIIKFVNDYTAKLNSLKATVGQDFAPNISATVGKDMEKTTVTFDSFEKKLAELLKGNGSMGQLRSEFTALDGAVKNLGANLRGSDTSLNQFTNAINNARKFDNDLKALEVDYNNLNEKQRESETLTKSLADAQKKLGDLQFIQKTEGYTEKWIDQYHQVSIALTQLTADLKLAKKLEREDTSSAAHKQAAALREVKDAYNEILSLSRKLYQPNATGEYRAEIERQIAVYDAIIKKLEGEKEFNEEFRKEVTIYKEAYQDELRLMQLKNSEAAAQKAKNEEIARQKALQQELTRIETEALREQARQQQELDSQRKKDLDEISGIYTKIISLYGKINSTTISEADKKDAERRLSLYNDMVVAVVERAKAEGTYNQEFRRQIDEHEKIYQREYDLIQLHREDAEAIKAANEQAKQQEANLKLVENTLKDITNHWEKIKSLNAKLTSGKLPEAEANAVQKQIEQEEVLATKAKLRLRDEGLLTEELQKQINRIKQQAEAIIDARNQQKASNEELAKNIKTYEDGLKAIQNAYTAIANATKTVYSGKTTDKEKSYALADIAVQRDLLSTIQERLAAQGLIDDAINEEIKKGEILVTRTQQIAQSKAQEAQATRDERDAERELTEQARQHNKELKETENYINKAVTALEKFNNSTVAKNNASNPAVASQTGLNADLINQLRGLQESLANDKSPENIARIIARMNELDGSLKDATARSAELNQSLKDDDASAKFSAKLNNLKNQVDIFANTNRRATESLRLMRDGETTFAQGWQNIRDALSNGNLDSAGLQRLTEQFRNFRGEADAAGMTVSRFFQSMQSQLRMVLQRWISLYAVIGYIRKMIDNVKELDNAMINLRRVTDETDAGYQRFLEDANELARQMKTTTASLVEMSYQWSKLGYSMNEALELSKASTIFMRVADVGQDQALSNLVTSLKAFRLEASQTMDVVDKLDKLNNEYAVSASGLGQGLERSASAMAMTGNSLEETLAMLTGAGEIVQNLENTGNALRVISLR